MDFKALREQILANIENYNMQETKIVVTKLLDFLVDTNDKRSKLEEENKQLFAEMNDLKKAETEPQEDYKSKIEEVISRANAEANRIIENAKQEAKLKIPELTKEAYEEKKAIIKNAIDQIEEVIESIKKKDEEAKLYRQHILSIFRKTIFRFSDSNYYIIRSEDKDFRDLLQFLEVDEKLQKLCDDNMEKLAQDEKFQKLVQSVEENKEKSDFDIKEIISEEPIEFEDKEIEIKEEYESIEEIEEDFEDEIEEITEKEESSPSSFLDVINRYKKNK